MTKYSVAMVVAASLVVGCVPAAEEEHWATVSWHLFAEDRQGTITQQVSCRHWRDGGTQTIVIDSEDLGLTLALNDGSDDPSFFDFRALESEWSSDTTYDCQAALVEGNWTHERAIVGVLRGSILCGRDLSILFEVDSCDH